MNKFIFLINIIFSFLTVDELLLLISKEYPLLFELEFEFEVISVLLKLPLETLLLVNSLLLFIYKFLFLKLCASIKF